MREAADRSVDEVDNLVRAIISNAASAAERPAMVENDRIISYAQLAELIPRYAGFLHELGLRPRSRLALVLQDHIDHLVLILAAGWLGAATLSINWRSKLEEKRAIADAFAVDLAIHDPGTTMPRHVRAVPFDKAWRTGAAQATPREPESRARELTFRILLTSGSTGTPKGVELTHAGALGWCEVVRRALHLQTAQRHLSASPLAFTGSMVFNLPQLLFGNTIELFPAFFTPEEFITAVRTREVTGSIIVPTVLRQLLTLGQGPKPLLPGLNYLVSLGAPLRPDERRAARELVTPFFYDNYGASGAGPITFLGPKDIATHADSVGRAAPLREVQIVDELDRPLAAGPAGRLRCRGVGVANRFCNAGDGNDSESFRNGWYYPGEIARMDGDGFIYLTGRASDLILRRGNNVYPAEVEEVLARHANVREAAVMGAPLPDNDEDVIAFVRVSATTPESELLEICRRNLVAYKVPRSIMIVDEFPRTPSGKVIKAELLRMFQSRYGTQPT